MTCRLCKEDHNLKNSHIIPEFFYKPIYDSKHRLLARKSGKLVQGRPLQKGIREKLLCEGCEQQLGRNEKYVREVLFGGTKIGIQSFQDRLVLSNLDYTKVRLFFLSLIWRMSVASEDAIETRGRPTFQEWLQKRHADLRITVYDHPTLDFFKIPQETLAAIKADLDLLFSLGRTVVLVDSGGETRNATVCRFLGAVEDSSNVPLNAA